MPLTIVTLITVASLFALAVGSPLPPEAPQLNMSELTAKPAPAPIPAVSAAAYARAARVKVRITGEPDDPVYQGQNVVISCPGCPK